MEHDDSEGEKKRKRSPTPEPAPSTMDFNEIPGGNDMPWLNVTEANDEEMDVERAISVYSRSSGSTDRGRSASRTASTHTPEPEHASRSLPPESSKPALEPPKKKARMTSTGLMKGQPTVQANESGPGTERDSSSAVSAPSVVVGKHHKKNAKKRQKEKERKQLEMATHGQAADSAPAVTRKEPSPPPTRDPALDLLAGYRCTEVNRSAD